MHDAQARAPLAGLSPTPRPAVAGQQVCPVPSGPILDSLETAFEQDLALWLEQLYAVRAERQVMRQMERVYGVGWLAVAAMTLAVPVLGVVPAFAAALLLVVTLGVAWRLAIAGSLDEHADGRQRAPALGPTAWNELPMFGPDERARLVRLMNLSRARWRPATRMLLRAEWRDARSCGSLADWGPLYDLEDVVLDNAFASEEGPGNKQL